MLSLLPIAASTAVLVLVMSGTVRSASVHANHEPGKPLRLYFTGYDASLYTYDLDVTGHPVLKEASPPLVNKTGTGPSWISFSNPSKSQLKRLYVTSETSTGVVFELDADKGQPVVVGREEGFDVASEGPVASCVANSQLFMANYDGESLSILDLNPDGSISSDKPPHVIPLPRPASSPTGPVSNRQEKSHPHDATASPDGRYVYINDLGADVIHTIKVGSDASQSVKVGETKVEEGSGPRHLSFYRDEGTKEVYGYSTNELATTVQVYRQDVETDAHVRLQRE